MSYIHQNHLTNVSIFNCSVRRNKYANPRGTRHRQDTLHSPSHCCERETFSARLRYLMVKRERAREKDRESRRGEKEGGRERAGDKQGKERRGEG